VEGIKGEKGGGVYGKREDVCVCACVEVVRCMVFRLNMSYILLCACLCREGVCRGGAGGGGCVWRVLLCVNSGGPFLK